MSEFVNKTLTNDGLVLLSAALAGSKIEFTRIAMGAGSYSGDLASVTDLIDLKQSLNINSINQNGSQVTLSSTLTQSEITSDFYWKEIGVYARGDDGIEILYMYGNTENASYISNTMLNEKIINIGVLVSNASNISAVIDTSLVYVTSQDLEAHDNNPDAHEPIRKWVQNLFNSISLSWNNITGKPSTFPPEDHSHNTLTFQIAGTTKSSYTGAAAKTFNVPAATKTTAGVMTAAQVTLLETLDTDFDDLKQSVIDWKKLVTDAINDKLNTSLDEKTSGADIADYIKKYLIRITSVKKHMQTIMRFLAVTDTRIMQGGTSLGSVQIAANTTVTIPKNSIIIVSYANGRILDAKNYITVSNGSLLWEFKGLSGTSSSIANDTLLDQGKYDSDRDSLSYIFEVEGSLTVTKALYYKTVTFDELLDEFNNFI